MNDKGGVPGTKGGRGYLGKGGKGGGGGEAPPPRKEEEVAEWREKEKTGWDESGVTSSSYQIIMQLIMQLFIIIMGWLVGGLIGYVEPARVRRRGSLFEMNATCVTVLLKGTFPIGGVPC